MTCVKNDLNQTGRRPTASSTVSVGQAESAPRTPWGRLCLPFEKAEPASMGATFKAYSSCSENSDRETSNTISIAYQAFVSQFTAFLKNYLNGLSSLPFKGHKVLKEAIEYSLFSNGKYFRPLLVWATAEWALVPTRLILPWAGAIEMAHVASLIHDDLPCMDNSLQRRGRPANHRLFGEDIALLAGNSLWVEAFRLIATKATPQQTGLWFPILSSALSFNGLMGGQALDIKAPEEPDLNYYKQMHLMKTGKLISACLEGVVAFPFVGPKKQKVAKAIAPLLGQAFQVADDLQDARTEKAPSNFAQGVSGEVAKKQLFELSDKALCLLDSHHGDEQQNNKKFIKQLIIFNQNRAT